jgi:hypothetical protein
VDFGFAPGSDGQIQSLQGMFSRRLATTLISKPGVTTIHAFVNALDTSTGITKPIGDVLIGGHANDEGQLFILAFAGQQGPTLFETLEKTLSDPTKSIAISDTLIGRKPGDPITHTVHIKGCNIGKAQPFLVKLREALGNNVRVTAPNFFHGLTAASQQGLFEYMGYEFLVRRREAFRDRQTALAVFDAEQFKLINGSTVPTADWNTLVPPDPNVTRKLQMPAHLGVTIAGRKTINVPRQYRAIPIRFVWGVFFSDARSVPTDEFTQRQALAESLQNETLKRFSDTHQYPQWTREGFTDFEEFLGGHVWKYQRKGATLICVGTRFLYAVVLAVTDPATVPPNGFCGDGNLIFNLYPNSGSGLTQMTTAIQVTDPTYFTTV